MHEPKTRSVNCDHLCRNDTTSLGFEHEWHKKMRQPLCQKTILVVGGAGFIGSHLVDRLLLAQAKKVIVVDNFFVGSIENLNKALGDHRVVLHREDAENFQDLKKIFEQDHVDVVFNCATKALNYSFIDPSDTFSTNIKVVLNLLELLRHQKFHTLCHLSTSEVYGTTIYEPMDEHHPKNPTTTYAAGKASADLAVESYVKMFDVDAMIMRPFNNFGPRQNYQGPLAGIIPTTAMKILNGEAPEVHGDGTQSREFVYVLDTVEALIKLYRCLPSGDTINISTDNELQISSLISMIAEQLDYGGEILRLPGRKADVQRHVACCKKLSSFIDCSITQFDEALSETLAFYRAVSVEAA